MTFATISNTTVSVRPIFTLQINLRVITDKSYLIYICMFVEV